ncbi:hypothetical protein J2Y67_003791 [Neobacillus niacini]|nr:hypothetical protein [Neobacillus niacini]
MIQRYPKHFQFSFGIGLHQWKKVYLLLLLVFVSLPFDLGFFDLLHILIVFGLVYILVNDPFLRIVIIKAKTKFF